MPSHTVLITGAAGYVGAMLCRAFAARPDVQAVVALDKEPMPEFIGGDEKITYIQMNTADEWEDALKPHRPDIVVHAAWQIRELYGKQEIGRRWNIAGSDRVFDFCLGAGSPVRRLVYFSTVASYGAFPGNSIEHRFTEEEPLRRSDYSYAEEKRIAEEHLWQKFQARGNRDIEVAIVRPAAITGPRGRFMRIRFGLQAALSGQLKENFLYRLITRLVSVVPVTPTWCRQFIHEDDVVDLTELLSFDPRVKGCEAYNICPPGPVVRGMDMARAVGKRTVRVSPYLVRFAFFVMWHVSRGKVPTGRGAWKGYSYPIAVDGSKLTRALGYHYKTESLDAFYYTNGRYEEYVPPEARRHKV